MPSRSSTRLNDDTQLAIPVVDQVAHLAQQFTEDGKSLAAVALGRLGGLKGGKARAEKLTPNERASIARKAAKARWSAHRAESGEEK